MVENTEIDNLAIAERIALALTHNIINIEEAALISDQKNPQEMINKFSEILKTKEDERGRT